MPKQPKFTRIKPFEGKPDISEWTLPAIDALEEQMYSAVLIAAGQAVDLAMESNDTAVSWPHIWSDKSGRGTGHLPIDKDRKRKVTPLTIFLTIDIGSDPFHAPIYAFDLREALSLSLDECNEDGSYSEGLRRVMLELRSLADEIEAVLPK